MGVKSILQQGGDGTAVPAGMVGELFGSERAGTGGKTYSTRTSTAITPSNTFVKCLSYTLNKGLYLVSYYSSILPIADSILYTEVRVGGTQINGVASDAIISSRAGIYANAIGCLPVLISADSTELSVDFNLVTTTSSSAYHEMWITRLAGG